MAKSLIINQYKALPLYRRLYSNAMTLALWALWIYLWRPVLKTLYSVIGSGQGFEGDIIGILDCIAPISIYHVLSAVLGTSCALLLFALLPSRKLHPTHLAYTEADYAKHFNVDESVLATSRNASVCTVHHTKDGQISGLTL